MGAAERTPLPLADPRDPRCLAPLALAGRVSALATAVPHAGALVREARTARRGTPFWLVTFRLVAGEAAGAYAELRLWPASESGRFERLLCDLTGETDEAVGALDEPARLQLLETTLRSRSLHLTVEIAADGRCTVVFADGLDERVEPGPGLPEPAPARVVAPPPPAARPALGAPRYELVEDAAGLTAACAWIARTERVALDIETDCGPLGSPAWWEPDDGAIRLVQVAGEVDGQVRCAVVDCYRVAPGRLLRLLAEPERQIVAHNARYEQRWLAFHHGLPAWQRVLDTSVGYRVLEAHWRLQDPAYEPIGASLVAVSRQLLGVEKGPYGGSWWGSERLTREQLDYAALDALTLLPIARRIEELASAMGCAGQIAAASATACREGLRRMPEGPAAVRDELWGMLGAVRDPDGLARVGRIAARVPLAAADRGALRDEYRRRRDLLP